MNNAAIGGFAKGKDPVNIVLALLKEMAVPVAAATVREELRSHPYYPSLFCIADSLQRWGLETVALDVPYSGLMEVPCPFLAHCPIAGDDPYLIVKDVSGGEVIYVDGRRKRQAIRKDMFFGIWDGKVLVMERRGEAAYSGRRDGGWRGKAGIGLLLAVLCLPLVIGMWRFLALQGFAGRVYFLVSAAGNLFGAFIALLLLRHDYGFGGNELQRWCSLNGRMSCEAVLRSGMARPAGWASWSEIGFVYFAGSLFYEWWGRGGAVFPVPMVVFQLLALGYVVFSLTYQGLVVKKWCLLCLAIQGVLVIEAVAAIRTGQARKVAGIGGALLGSGGVGADFHGAYMDIGIVLYAYLVPAVGLVLLRRYLLGQKERVSSRQGLNRLKRNELVFETLLRQEDEIKGEPPAVGLFMGSAEAEHSILLVTNPDCPPCVKAHRQVEELMRVNPRWRAQVIFSIPVGQESLVSGLADHFADAGEAARSLAIMREWCEKENIRYTPAIFADGRRLPELYEIGDLQFL